MSEKEKSILSLNEQIAVEVKKDLRVLTALVRTAFSSEQSLMSWIRTSVSLFTFGFSISQFFYFLEQQKEGIQLSSGPRMMGITLICVGIIVLLFAMVEHVHRLKMMQKKGLPRISQYLLPLGSALALLAIGIAALIVVSLGASL
jgi:putative membrane protein